MQNIESINLTVERNLKFLFFFGENIRQPLSSAEHYMPKHKNLTNIFIIKPSTKNKKYNNKCQEDRIIYIF